MKAMIIPRAALLAAVVLVDQPAAVFSASGSHAPIVIASNADFQACSCVSDGSGTASDPYIIGPWTINSLPSGGVGVSVDGTVLTKSFTLFNLTIAGNGDASSLGILLNHINPSGQNTISAAVTGLQTSIQSAGIGIAVENSNHVTLDGGDANPNGAGKGAAAPERSIKTSSAPSMSRPAATLP